MSELRAILRALSDAGARVVVVGGVALQLHGSSYITADIDFAFERTRENAERIAMALGRFSPRPREFPPDVPVVDAAAETMEFDGFSIRVLTIDGLIMAKRAAGRPKDTAGLVELELLREAKELALEQEPDERDAR